MILFPEKVFSTLISNFCKNQKTLNRGKITKFEEKNLKKNAFILLKGLFNKMGGRKICRC